MPQANGETDLGRGGIRMSRTLRTRFAIAFGTALLTASIGASSVLAGEVTGPPGEGTHTPIGAAPDDAPHARSICSFSGLDDGEDAPGRTAEHVQSWGQIPKLGLFGRDHLRTLGVSPGDLCNGHTGEFSGTE
jgi:hypothetical protein